MALTPEEVLKLARDENSKLANPMPDDLLVAVLKQESGIGASKKSWTPNATGNVGPFQIMSKAGGGKYANFESMGGTDISDPEQLVRVGARFAAKEWQRSGQNIDQFSRLYFGPGVDKVSGNMTAADYSSQLRQKLGDKSMPQPQSKPMGTAEFLQTYSPEPFRGANTVPSDEQQAIDESVKALSILQKQMSQNVEAAHSLRNVGAAQMQGGGIAGLLRGQMNMSVADESLRQASERAALMEPVIKNLEAMQRAARQVDAPTDRERFDKEIWQQRENDRAQAVQLNNMATVNNSLIEEKRAKLKAEADKAAAQTELLRSQEEWNDRRRKLGEDQTEYDNKTKEMEAIKVERSGIQKRAEKLTADINAAAKAGNKELVAKYQEDVNALEDDHITTANHYKMLSDQRAEIEARMKENTTVLESLHAKRSEQAAKVKGEPFTGTDSQKIRDVAAANGIKIPPGAAVFDMQDLKRYATAQQITAVGRTLQADATAENSPNTQTMQDRIDRAAKEVGVEVKPGETPDQIIARLGGPQSDTAKAFSEAMREEVKIERKAGTTAERIARDASNSALLKYVAEDLVKDKTSPAKGLFMSTTKGKSELNTAAIEALGKPAKDTDAETARKATVHAINRRIEDARGDLNDPIWSRMMQGVDLSTNPKLAPVAKYAAENQVTIPQAIAAMAEYADKSQGVLDRIINGKPTVKNSEDLDNRLKLMNDRLQEYRLQVGAQLGRDGISVPVDKFLAPSAKVKIAGDILDPFNVREVTHALLGQALQNMVVSNPWSERPGGIDISALNVDRRIAEFKKRTTAAK